MPSLVDPRQDRIGEARRLRDTARFAEAVELLEAHLAQQPDDVEAARLRAQTLYWLKDNEGARAAYADALARHPGHEGLRIDYAQMLAETGDLRDARDVLAPVVAGDASGRAATLLGTILYWQGDFTGAKRQFEQALRRDPGLVDAVRQLREIRFVASPWIRVAPTLWHDDQPLDRAGVAVEGGWFLTPLLSVTVRSEPMRTSTASARTFWSNEVELSHVAPAAGLDTRLSLGVFRRPGSPQSLEWTGRGALGLRAGPGVTLRGRIARAPYLHTAASLETPTMATTAGGSVHLDAQGWLGEAAVERQFFPDENAVRSAYAWVLAPIVRRETAALQVGYAIAAANADEDRFALASPQQPVLPDDPRFDFSGVYRPYYTPARSLVHSALVGLSAGTARGPMLRAGGSYGFRAREDATAFQPSNGQVIAVVGRRDFTPWTARVSLEVPASPSFTFGVGGEAGRAAYYRWTSAWIGLIYRFVPSGGRQ